MKRNISWIWNLVFISSTLFWAAQAFSAEKHWLKDVSSPGRSLASLSPAQWNPNMNLPTPPKGASPLLPLTSITRDDSAQSMRKNVGYY